MILSFMVEVVEACDLDDDLLSAAVLAVDGAAQAVLCISEDPSALWAFDLYHASSSLK
jgi:hypothetical protein